MKKVLIIAAALSLFAAPAFAAISGTAHDLANGPFGNGTINEVCVYCHTPHGADTTVTLAPLWNRSTVDATAVYTGLDLQATITTTTVNATDAPLCLSCHDGTSVADVLNNMPNSGGTQNTTPITGDAALDTDLSDDHPVGFNFATVAGLDAEIETLANATSVGKIKFFGGANDQMWCSSCHDVHDNTEAPFLNTTNSGSTLCLACHIK